MVLYLFSCNWNYTNKDKYKLLFFKRLLAFFYLYYYNAIKQKIDFENFCNYEEKYDHHHCGVFLEKMFYIEYLLQLLKNFSWQ